MSNKQTFSHALAKIQQLQDMFSRYFQVSISIHSTDTLEITIPSNQNAFCYNKLVTSDSLCQNFMNQMQEQLLNELIVTTCPYQCAFAIAPLSSSLEPYDYQPSEYYITIVQDNRKSSEEILADFQTDPFGSHNDQLAEFHEAAHLILFSFNTVFALMKSEKMSLELDIPKTIQKEDLNALTVREKEILHLVSVGMSNQQIAAQLFISEHTVKAHISNILKKLNLSNRTQLAIYEIQSL